MDFSYQYGYSADPHWWLPAMVGGVLFMAALVNLFRASNATLYCVIGMVVIGIALPMDLWRGQPPLRDTTLASAIQNTYKVDSVTNLVSQPHPGSFLDAYTMTVTSSVDHKPYLYQYQQTTPDRQILHSHFPYNPDNRFEVDGKLSCIGITTVVLPRRQG